MNNKSQNKNIKSIQQKNQNNINNINQNKKKSYNQGKNLYNKNNNKSNLKTKNQINKEGFDIYDPKNAVEFNRQFLGLSGNGGGEGNGIFVGEGIFNMNLPMHRPGEVPDFSNPYGNNFFGKNKGTGRPLNPRTQPLEYLQQFFGGFGIEFPIPKKPNINKINVIKHNYNRNILNNNHIIDNVDLFDNNFCSNFRSNLEKEAFDYLLNLLKGNRILTSQQKQTPIKNDILQKLNKFEMNENYMKKNDNKLEAPFCCICLNDIILKQKCILLPCGHLLHSKCLELWLKKNSVCPMCRLDLNNYYSNI